MSECVLLQHVRNNESSVERSCGVGQDRHYPLLVGHSTRILVSITTSMSVGAEAVTARLLLLNSFVNNSISH